MDENLLTRTYGPLKGWQWAAIAGGAAIAFVLYRRYQAAQAAASGSTTSAAGTTAQDQATGAFGSSSPPVVIVEQPAQPNTPNTPPSPTPAPPKTLPKTTPTGPPTPVPPAINWKSFPALISGLSPQGGTLRSFATIENGRVTGGEVRNGAPVYALVENPKFGPIWEQSFNPKALPNGTKVATLPQFSNLIVRGKAA